MKPKRFLSAVVVVASFVFGSTAFAQSAYPGKPVRIIVGFGPGGPTDVAARLVGGKLAEVWGQQVLVENRPGGNGFIGMSAAAKSAPDGYTLMLAANGELAVVPILYKDAPYNVQRDFVPITLVSDVPVAFATGAGTPYRSVADVIAAAKATPGLAVSLPGNGTNNQIIMEWLALNAGVKFQGIPYKGSGPGAAALAAGEVPLAMLAHSSLAPHVKSGRVRILAVTSTQRSALAPDVPTMQEQGIAEVNGSTWTALLAPAGTPSGVVEKINADVRRVLQMPDVKERFAAGGAETIPSTPAELAARIKRDVDQYAPVVQRAGVKAE